MIEFVGVFAIGLSVFDWPGPAAFLLGWYLTDAARSLFKHRERWQWLRAYPDNGIVGFAIAGDVANNDGFLFVEFHRRCVYWRCRETENCRAIRGGFGLRPAGFWFIVEDHKSKKHRAGIEVFFPLAVWLGRRWWFGRVVVTRNG